MSQIDPLFDSDDTGLMHWSAHAYAAWANYLTTGDQGDLQDALIAAENYHAARERLSRRG